MDRFDLAKDAANLVYGKKAADFSERMDCLLAKHCNYIKE